MDILQAIVLALVQGITEFLPISSSAHLVLVPELTSWPDQGLAFDVALHVGTLAAVLLYFRRELVPMAADFTRSLGGARLTRDARLAWALLLGTIPVGIAGLVFQDAIEANLRSIAVIAWTSILFGLLLGWADWARRGEKTEYAIGWREVAVIACAQALSLIPGTSRAGITITAALLVGMSREAGARFSFLLSIPVIVLAGGLELISLLDEPTAEVYWPQMALATVLSGIVAYLCIHYFLAFIRRVGMLPFVVYRVALGVLLLIAF